MTDIKEAVRERYSQAALRAGTPIWKPPRYLKPPFSPRSAAAIRPRWPN